MIDFTKPSEGPKFDASSNTVFAALAIIWRCCSVRATGTCSGIGTLLLLLLPGGIIPGCVRVTFSFALRGHAPTHLAIPAGQLSIPCMVPICHCVVLCCRGLPSLPTPSPRVKGLTRTTPCSTPYKGGSIPGEQQVQFKVLL